jgi:mRNA interferase RelE/StbE
MGVKMVEIIFTRRALRDIRKLQKDVQRRVELAMDELFDDIRAGDRLHGEWEGYWKLRVGDYRIIYKIKSEKQVEIQYVRHRRGAYRGK